MLSKNFLATHQVDVHLWTEFPYTLCPQTSFSHIVSTKRALNIYKSSDFCPPVSGLPDHFVRLEEQRWGNREPKRLGDLEADDEGGCW
jgi:hypothetical protein